jgi:hypothetical protein
MAKDPRKSSAYDSGLRGRETPKDGAGTKQGPSTKVGNPDGEGATAFSSGMRGSQKPPAKASPSQMGNGGEHCQEPGSVIGQPGGIDTAGEGKRAGVQPGEMQASAGEARNSMDENSLERSAAGMSPEADEDDTHINIRVPKSSIRRKQGGVNKA